MKTKILALFLGLFFVLSSASAQSVALSGFNGRIDFSGFANNGGNIRGTLKNFTDQSGLYVASNIATGDVAWDNNGKRYAVVAVISSNATQAVVDLIRIGGGTHIPKGAGFVSRETSNGLALIPTQNSTGISAPLASRAAVHNMKILEGLKTIYTGGDSIRVPNILVKMANNGTQSLGIGELPSFPNRSYNYDETGLLLSRGTAGEVGLLNRKDYLTSYGDSWFITSNRRGAEILIDGAGRYVDLRGARLNGSFVVLRIDSTSVTVLDQNGGQYTFPLPSVSIPDISNIGRSIMVWDGDNSVATSKFITSKNRVFTGTTDGNGDLQIIIPSVPDNIYSVLITVEGTTSYTTSVHSKLTGNFKVRFYNPATGAAVTATSISCSYLIQDY